MSSRVRGRGKPKKKESAAREVEEEVKKVEKAAVREAKKVERKIERKVERRKAPAKPSGRIPMAMVEARHAHGMITRTGRGFSIGELSGGGLSRGKASSWGVKVDPLRRSVLDGNVSALKAWHATGRAAEVEHEAKKIEGELEGAGEEVEREAVIAGEEVLKVAKEVKKEAKKSEKAVREKVGKLKAKPKKKEKS